MIFGQYLDNYKEIKNVTHHYLTVTRKRMKKILIIDTVRKNYTVF